MNRKRGEPILKPLHHEQLALILYNIRPVMDRELWIDLTQSLAQFIYRHSDNRKFDGKKFLNTCGFFD